MRQASHDPATRAPRSRPTDRSDRRRGPAALLALGLLLLPGQSMADDYPADSTTGGSVSQGGQADGEIEFGNDRDWFALDGLSDGEDYLFHMKGADSGSGTLADSFLRLVDSSGTVLKEDDDSGKGYDAMIAHAYSAGETLYLEADNASDYSTGTYSIEVTTYEDDCGDDPEGACDLTGVQDVGEVTGKIEVGADTDWFLTPYLKRDTSYRFDLQGADGEDGPLADPELELRDAGGSLLTSDDNGGAGNDAHLTRTFSSDTRFHLVAGSADDTAGDYTVSYSTYADDCLAHKAPGCSLSQSSDESGTLEVYGDSDWFEVTVLNDATSLRFDLEGAATSAGTLSDPRLVLFDAAGTELAADDDTGEGDNARLTYTLSGSEETPLYIAAQSGSGGDEGTYTLGLTLFEDDCPDNDTTGCGVAVDGQATGNLEVAGDGDWFEVTGMTAGESYRFDLEGAETGAGTLPDPRLGIHDPGGELIVNENGGTGANAALAFTPSSGDVSYFASAGSGTDGDWGTYTLSVAPFTGDDYAQDTGTTGSLSVGGSTEGVLELAGDHDWLEVSLQQGSEYTLLLEGTVNGDYGPLPSPHLRLLDSQGAEVAAGYSKVISADSELVFTPESTGTFYVEAGEKEDAYSGGYTVSATLASTADSGSGDSTTGDSGSGDSGSGDGGGGSGGGGCALSTTPKPPDPVLLLLLGLSLAYLRGRRRSP